jgi:hypothetical protein
MPKSTALNFTQRLQNASAAFSSADLLRVVAVAPNANGSGLTAGTRAFTAAAGTVQTGGAAAAWTATVTDGRVIGVPVITEAGAYLVTPTATANAATVDSGTTTATWNLRVEALKDLYTASGDDAVVKAISVSSTDTAARVVSLWIIGADNQPTLVGAVNIPLRSGDNGTAAAVDLLGGTLMPALPLDATGKRALPLRAGQRLAVSVPAVTAGTLINVSAQIEEY